MLVGTKTHKIFDDTLEISIYRRDGWYYAEGTAQPGQSTEVGPARCAKQAYEECLQRMIAEYPLFYDRYYKEPGFLLNPA